MGASASFWGRLGKDPEQRQMGNLTATTFSVAVKTSFKDREGNYISNWYDCTAFGKDGEYIMQYCKKGSLVFVTGLVASVPYQGNDGSTKYFLKVQVKSVESISAGTGSNTSSGGNKKPAQVKATPVQQQEDDDDEDEGALPF